MEFDFYHYNLLYNAVDRTGLAYFGEGIKTLFSDIQYAWILIFRAVQGYTLKPRYCFLACLNTSTTISSLNFCIREVNAIRRTGKDLLTLIPFVVILIIPLTPIGHVLVFSFIQVGFFFISVSLSLPLVYLEIFPRIFPILLPRETNQPEKAFFRN